LFTFSLVFSYLGDNISSILKKKLPSRLYNVFLFFSGQGPLIGCISLFLITIVVRLPRLGNFNVAILDITRLTILFLVCTIIAIYYEGVVVRKFLLPYVFVYSIKYLNAHGIAALISHHSLPIAKVEYRKRVFRYIYLSFYYFL